MTSYYHRQSKFRTPGHATHHFLYWRPLSICDDVASMSWHLKNWALGEPCHGYVDMTPWSTFGLAVHGSMFTIVLYRGLRVSDVKFDSWRAQLLSLKSQISDLLN